MIKSIYKIAITTIVILTFPISIAFASHNFMQRDAMSTKEEVLKYMPIGSAISDAQVFMVKSGFKCSDRKNSRYADFANSSNKQIDRGPANFLYCDSGQKRIGFFTKRWQISFEDVEGKITYIGVGVGLTGP